MNEIEYPVDDSIQPTSHSCYGMSPRPITLSWSRLSDFMKCNYRVKLIHEGKKSKLFNARNVLAGKVADLSMRHALEHASKDSEGRLLSLSLEELLDPLPAMWENSTQNLEKNTIMQWSSSMSPQEDQKRILGNAQRALKNLHPILESKVVGHRFIPEFRPTEMPVFGIPSPDGTETRWIRLFLAVDCAVQLAEDPDNPNALGEWGLYDLKTTPTEDYLEKTLPQLVFYDLAFHALTGKRPVEHALWAPLVKPPIRTLHITDEHRMQVTNWIISYCHGVWAGKDDFTKDPANCYSCPTKAACPKVTLPISKDKQGLSRVYFGGNPKDKLQG